VAQAGGKGITAQEYYRQLTQLSTRHQKISDDIDELLRDYARSSLLDPDPDAKEQTKKRRKYLNEQLAISPSLSKKSKKPKKMKLKKK